MKLLPLVIGLISGVVATGPMTAAMIAWHRRLPAGERYPLPPREITMKLARKTGVAAELSAETRSAATLLAHFGYGAAAGAVYTALPQPWRSNATRGGVIYGLIVWLTSYLGLLPSARILTPATEHPAGRNALMIAAHVVWGLALGWLVEILLSETRQSAAPPLSTSPQPHRDVA
jgi:uncharacterized membrane protein YagU involved in acid resistance